MFFYDNIAKSEKNTKKSGLILCFGQVVRISGGQDLGRCS